MFVPFLIGLPWSVFCFSNMSTAEKLTAVVRRRGRPASSRHPQPATALPEVSPQSLAVPGAPGGGTLRPPPGGEVKLRTARHEVSPGPQISPRLSLEVPSAPGGGASRAPLGGDYVGLRTARHEVSPGTPTVPGLSLAVPSAPGGGASRAANWPSTSPPPTLTPVRTAKL